MSDLEKFLQQAAQRMKERQQAGQQPPAPNPPARTPPSVPPPPAQPSRPPQRKPQPVRQAEREVIILDDEDVVTADIVSDEHSRSQGPNRLSNIDTRPAPGTTNVSMADERMASHLQQAFDHNLGQLSQKSTGQVNTASAASGELTNKKIEVESQATTQHWLAKTLQNPDSLRTAFIASEIFQRRF